MSINYKVQAGVARVLATENLVVEHRSCDTAQFDVHSRVLTLPNWDKASESVFDLLVAHEVGHALYTPDIDWSVERDIHKGYGNVVNIVEDARIEKLMKRRYGGLPKIFYRGYSQMTSEDFFELGNIDVNSLSLPDRINLYFKIGNFHNIQFSPEEETIVDMVRGVETFDDVLDTVEAIIQHIENPPTPQSSGDGDSSEDSSEGNQSEGESGNGDQGESEGKGSGSEGESDDSESDEEDGDDGDSDQDSDQRDQNQGPSMNGGKQNPNSSKQQSPTSRDRSQSTGSNGAGKSSGAGSMTDKNLKKALNQLNSKYAKDNLYLEFPETYIDKIIVSNAKVHKYLDTWHIGKSCHYDVQESHKESDKLYKEYKSESIKEVNYLVKEFECKKSADAYSRATVSKTGVLDSTKLHTFKYNEDLFKKITTIPEGKNHGLIFILDWSGSMGNTLIQTIKQLFNLVNFCRKCNIPFDVYAFTESWARYPTSNVATEAPNTLKIDGDFRLMHILTSFVSGRVVEQQMKNIWRLVRHLKCDSFYPSQMCLSGTPLNETMCALREIIPQFQQKTKLQKTHCIILTDGEGNTLQYHKEITRRGHYGTYTQLGTNTVYYADEDVFLRSRITGKVYKFKKQLVHTHQDTLLEALQDEHPDVNFIAFRILDSGYEANKVIGMYCDGTTEQKMLSSWREHKVFNITTSPYNSYFGLSNDSLQNNVDYLDKLGQGATKSQIRSAMRKTLAGKKMNKKILSSFIDIVA